jgi:hypothetical protein
MNKWIIIWMIALFTGGMVLGANMLIHNFGGSLIALLSSMSAFTFLIKAIKKELK